jgi:guanine deaminase
MIMQEAIMQQIITATSKILDENRGGPFGAAVVKEGRIIAMGFNEVTSQNDPTSHAEIMAIRNACQHLNTYNLSGYDLYTSCEPCPMCLGAIYWSRIDKIFYGANRFDAAKFGFDDAYFYEEINKDYEHKTVPMQECLRKTALKLLVAWDNKLDKQPY